MELVHGNDFCSEQTKLLQYCLALELFFSFDGFHPSCLWSSLPGLVNFFFLPPFFRGNRVTDGASHAFVSQRVNIIKGAAVVAGPGKRGVYITRCQKLDGLLLAQIDVSLQKLLWLGNNWLKLEWSLALARQLCVLEEERMMHLLWQSQKLHRLRRGDQLLMARLAALGWEKLGDFEQWSLRRAGFGNWKKSQWEISLITGDLQASPESWQP